MSKLTKKFKSFTVNSFKCKSIEMDTLIHETIKEQIRNGLRLLVKIQIYDGYDHLLRESQRNFVVTNMYGALCYYYSRINLYRKSHIKAVVQLCICSDSIFDYHEILSDVC